MALSPPVVRLRYELTLRAVRSLVDEAIAATVEDAAATEHLERRLASIEQTIAGLDDVLRDARLVRTLIGGLGGPADGTVQEITNWLVPILRAAPPSWVAGYEPPLAPPPEGPRDRPAPLPKQPPRDRMAHPKKEKEPAVDRAVGPPVYPRAEQVRAGWRSKRPADIAEKEVFAAWLESECPPLQQIPCIEKTVGLEYKAAYMWKWHRTRNAGRAERPSSFAAAAETHAPDGVGLTTEQLAERVQRLLPPPAPPKAPPRPLGGDTSRPVRPVPVAKKEKAKRGWRSGPAESPPAGAPAAPARPLTPVRASGLIGAFNPSASRLDRTHVTDDDFLEVWRALPVPSFAAAADELSIEEPAARNIWRLLRRRGLVEPPPDMPVLESADAPSAG